MREIALIVPSLAVGGAERAMVTLANGLSQRGWRVDLVAAAGGGPLTLEVAPHVSVTDLGAGRVGLSLLPLMRFLSRHPRAAVLSAMTHMNVVSLLATRVLGRHRPPVYVNEVSLFSRGREGEPKLRAGLARMLMRGIYKRADSVICVSRSIADEVAERLGGRAASITTMPNPIDLAAVRHGAAAPPPHPWMTSEARSAFPALVSVGRLAPEKGLDVLLHAVAHMRQRGGNHRLLLIGDGPERAALTKLVAKLGPVEAVDFVGMQQNPWAYMAHADALVLASHAEGFGLVLVEAMACGTQVVSTRSGSAPEEILDFGRLGEMASAGDPIALAEAIERALETPRDPELLKLEVQRFDTDRLMGDYAKLLESDAGSLDRSKSQTLGYGVRPETTRSQWDASMRSTTYYKSPADLENAAAVAIVPTDVVLDIGCGIRPMTVFQPKVHMCLEPFEDYVQILQRRFRSEPGVVVLKSYALEGLQRLADRSIDSIFLLDVIEHMDKDAGREALRECERVARRQIVVCTPLGFMPQEYEDGELDGWGVAHNKLQEHLSGWEPADFPEGWSFKVCTDYHTTDSKGEPLPKPFGVFYAFRDFPSERPPLPLMPLLIGATLPPALVDGAVRSDIVELLSIYDPGSMGVASTYDGRPYSPLHNIPDLLAFSTERLDCAYHPIVWPAGWSDLAAGSRVPLGELDERFAAFIGQWSELCRGRGYRSIVLCDFSAEEVRFARYLAEVLDFRIVILEGEGTQIAAEDLALLPGDTERLDLSAGVDLVRQQLAAITPRSLASTNV